MQRKYRLAAGLFSEGWLSWEALVISASILRLALSLQATLATASYEMMSRAG